MKTKDLSEVMTDAWRFYKGAELVSFSDCLKISWANYKLKKALKNGVVNFAYKKKNGETRKAVGTLKDGLVPATKGTKRSKSTATQIYYDLGSKGFRSYQKQYLI